MIRQPIGGGDDGGTPPNPPGNDGPVRIPWNDSNNNTIVITRPVWNLPVGGGVNMGLGGNGGAVISRMPTQGGVIERLKTGPTVDYFPDFIFLHSDNIGRPGAEIILPNSWFRRLLNAIFGRPSVTKEPPHRRWF